MTAADPSRPRQPFGPDEHKALAKTMGLPMVGKLYVLSKSDPFYCGTDNDQMVADWFAGFVERGGFTVGVHTRRVHYWALSTGQTMPDGATQYRNLSTCEAMLQRGSDAAKALGLVDPEMFVDRRNPAPMLFAHPREEEPEPAVEYAGADPDLWGLPAVSTTPGSLSCWGEFDVTGYDYHPADQPVLLEVWIEKTTMNDVLEPVCRGLAVNLVPASGFQSIPSVVQAIRRAQQHDKPLHILCVSDFDYAGDDMPRAIARKLQFWAVKLDAADVPITVQALALTEAQVAEYDLPPQPGKEDKRSAAFEARYGDAGIVELDALEAFHPGALQQRVRDAVRAYRDEELEDRLGDAEVEARQVIDADWQVKTAPIRERLQLLRTRIDETAAPVLDRARVLAEELRVALEPY